jgi:hypothetical protein
MFFFTAMCITLFNSFKHTSRGTKLGNTARLDRLSTDIAYPFSMPAIGPTKEMNISQIPNGFLDINLYLALTIYSLYLNGARLMQNIIEELSKVPIRFIPSSDTLATAQQAQMVAREFTRVHSFEVDSGLSIAKGLILCLSLRPASRSFASIHYEGVGEGALHPFTNSTN